MKKAMPQFRCLDFSTMGFPTEMLVRRSEQYQTDRLTVVLRDAPKWE